ncbi:MAG: hypothetical protein ACI4NG_04275 [Candidatus Gallimonas sp.]
MKQRYRLLSVLAIVATVVGAVTACKSEEKPSDDELYRAAVADAVFADEDEICNLVCLTKDDASVSWKEDKVLLVTYHNYPDSYPAGQTVTTGNWYMWTVTDREFVKRYAEVKDGVSDWSLEYKRLLGMPGDSKNAYFSAVWANVEDVIRPAYQPDPTVQLAAGDLGVGALGEYQEWFESNIIGSYFSGTKRYPWTRLGYTYYRGGDKEYGLSEFLILNGSEIEIEFTKTVAEFTEWLSSQASARA